MWNQGHFFNHHYLVHSISPTLVYKWNKVCFQIKKMLSFSRLALDDSVFNETFKIYFYNSPDWDFINSIFWTSEVPSLLGIAKINKITCCLFIGTKRRVWFWRYIFKVTYVRMSYSNDDVLLSSFEVHFRQCASIIFKSFSFLHLKMELFLRTL